MDDLYEANPDVTKANPVTKQERTEDYCCERKIGMYRFSGSKIDGPFDNEDYITIVISQRKKYAAIHIY